MNIQIPEPCHEDWGKMTQEEKGKFCGVCSKIVIDFSKFSDEELVNYFRRTPKQEKICGRFNTTQIDKKLEVKEHKFSTLVPVKKFAIAAFIAFGLTLFSCKTIEPDQHMVGEIAVEDTTIRANITNTVTPLPENVKVGMVEIMPEEPKEVKMGKIKVEEKPERNFIKGDIKIENTKADSISELKPQEQQIEHALGGVRIQYDEDEK